MPLDLTNLSPAPWMNGEAAPGFTDVCSGVLDHGGHAVCIDATPPDGEFIALARNAFEVMMERGWFPVRRPDGFWVVAWNRVTGPFDPAFEEWCIAQQFTDPFTALIEASRFVKERER